jgi:hypothetical protein
LILIVLFLDETFYDRRILQVDQPARGSRFSRLLGIQQFRSRHLRNSFGQAWMRPVRTILKPVIIISNFYYFLVGSL